MTNILTLLAGTGRSAAQTAAKSPQRAILENLAKSDPEKAKQAEERMNALQDTLRQMQQMRQDQDAARKEAARQKIARIKAQIQALKLSASGDPKANARQLARLARELQQAARDYSGAGGVDAGGGLGAAAPSGNDAAKASAGEAAPAAASAAGPNTAGTAAADAEETEAPAQENHGNTTAAAREEDSEGADSSARGTSEEDRAFAEEARRLQRQIKQMLQEQKRRLAEEGKNGAGDVQAAEAALREAGRQIQGIENPLPSIDIKV